MPPPLKFTFLLFYLRPDPFIPIYSYAGFLVSVDAYMNLQLASTEEYIDGQFTGNLGEVLIRCNNVLYLRGAPEEEEGGS